MTERTIVTLRSAPSATVEVPEKKKDGGALQRSCFGVLRLFPGIPKTVTRDELEHIKQAEPDLYNRLTVQPYVESKRVDRRGAGEAEIAKLAEQEGIAHLPHGRQVELLRERGKIRKPGKQRAAVSEKPSGKPGGKKPGGR
jgi:hypothetical protein